MFVGAMDVYFAERVTPRGWKNGYAVEGKKQATGLNERCESR